MNKLLTKIVGAALGLTMTVGVGVAVANSNRTVEPAHAATDVLAVDTAGSNSDGILTAVVAKASGQNAPITATVNTHDGVRLYANNTLTVSASSNITNLSIVWYKNGSKTFASVTTDVGSYTHASSSGNAGTWTGSASEVVFTVGASGQIQLYEISYTTSGGSGPTLSSVAISGDLTKKSYTTAESWNPAGLTVTGTYSDSSTANVTSSATFAYYSNSAMTSAVATPNDLGTGASKTVYIKATVSGISNSTGYAQTVSISTPSYVNTTGYTDGGVYAISHVNGGTTYYLKDNGTSSTPTCTTTLAEATAFTIVLVGDNTFQLTDGAASNTKYLYCNSTTGTNVRFGTTTDSWQFTETSSGSGLYYLKDTLRSHYLAWYNTTSWRNYTSTGNGEPQLKLVEAVTDPEITKVEMTGSPAASATLGGGASWTMSATVTAINDEGESLSRNVNWTVSPAGAVTFAKTRSASGENITVTATNTANNGVVITAASAATGFTTVKATSNSFNIIKSYDVSSVSLSTTTSGGPNYDAAGASSFDVSFTTSVNYSGDAGSSKVNITVDPSTGVSGYGDNVTAGSFTLTFTKSGNYTITSTSVEKNTKYASVSISIDNIVAPGYQKAESTGDFRNGSEVVIGSSAKGVLMKNAAASAAIGYTSYAVSEGFIPENDLPSDAVIFTLHNTSGALWELTAKISATTYYLEYDASKQGSGNSASYTTASSSLTKWEIGFSNEGDLNLVPSTAESRSLRCNTSNSNFACYAGTQSTVQMYVKVDNSPYFSINTTNMYLGPRGTSTLTLTAHNGAADTITWTSGNTNYATVSPTSGLTTTVTGVAIGETTITATFTSGDYDPIVVTVHVIELDTYVNVGVTTFTKVTSTPAGGWAGTYLLVDETASEIFDGSASPLSADATKAVSISSSSITATHEMIASSFNIKASTNGYTLKSNSNYYVGNQSVSNGISTSIVEQYEVSIGNDGTITGLLSDGTTSSGTTLRHNASSGNNIWRFYTGTTGNEIALYKADGDIRAISSTLTSWYDNAKENEYLSCNASGTGSNIDWDSLYETAIEMLASEDYDTLKRMSSKSSEENGNYLEDFISDYDYLVAYKGYDDFLGRFDEGGAMYGTPRVVPMPISNIVSTNGVIAIVVVISMMTITAIGAYYFLRKRKEQ